jgi:hypothetical protein
VRVTRDWRDTRNQGLRVALGVPIARLKGWEYFSASCLGGPRPSVEEAHGKASGCHTRGKHRSDDPTGREACSPRFTLPKFPSQVRHMGFRPEPFILY